MSNRISEFEEASKTNLYGNVSFGCADEDRGRNAKVFASVLYEWIKEKIQNDPDFSLSGGSAVNYTQGENIEITEQNVINVLTTSTVEENNTRPITSAGVYAIMSDIETSLSEV